MMKKPIGSMLTKTLALVAFAGISTGCTPPNVTTNYATISTHSLQVAPDKTADVIWLQQFKGHEFVVMRCHNAAEGPTCVRAKTP